MRYKIPEDLKYFFFFFFFFFFFCQSEAVAFYLQRYVVYRKKKICRQKDFADMSSLIKNTKMKVLITFI